MNRYLLKSLLEDEMTGEVGQSNWTNTVQLPPAESDFGELLPEPKVIDIDSAIEGMNQTLKDLHGMDLTDEEKRKIINFLKRAEDWIESKTLRGHESFPITGKTIIKDPQETFNG